MAPPPVDPKGGSSGGGGRGDDEDMFEEDGMDMIISQMTFDIKFLGSTEVANRGLKRSSDQQQPHQESREERTYNRSNGQFRPLTPVSQEKKLKNGENECRITVQDELVGENLSLRDKIRALEDSLKKVRLEKQLLNKRVEQERKQHKDQYSKDVDDLRTDLTFKDIEISELSRRVHVLQQQIISGSEHGAHAKVVFTADNKVKVVHESVHPNHIVRDPCVNEFGRFDFDDEPIEPQKTIEVAPVFTGSIPFPSVYDSNVLSEEPEVGPDAEPTPEQRQRDYDLEEINTDPDEVRSAFDKINEQLSDRVDEGGPKLYSERIDHLSRVIDDITDAISKRGIEALESQEEATSESQGLLETFVTSLTELSCRNFLDSFSRPSLEAILEKCSFIITCLLGQEGKKVQIKLRVGLYMFLVRLKQLSPNNATAIRIMDGIEKLDCLKN